MNAKTQSFKATGTGPIAESLSVDGPCELICVRLHLSAVGGAAESFTITNNSDSGAAWDCVYYSQDMNVLADLLWQPEQAVPMLSDDVLDCAWANSNSRTWGLEILFRRVNV